MSRKHSLPAPPAAFIELAGSWLATLLIVTIVGYFLLETFSAHQSRRAQESHLLVRLSHTRDSVEASLELGFPIGGLPSAQALLEDLLARDPMLLALDIFDSQGFIRFSTDRGSIGDATPDSWREINAKDIFSATTGETSILGVALHGSFGEIEGYIVATYRPALRAISHPLRLVVTLGVISLIALLAIAFYFSRSPDTWCANAFLTSAPELPPTHKMSAAVACLTSYDHRFATALDTLEQESLGP